MRKITILCLLLAFSVFSFGQMNRKFDGFKTENKKSNLTCEQNMLPMNVKEAKAFGDSIWGNDFSNAGDWTLANSTGDCQSWIICTPGTVTALYGVTAIQSATAANGFACFNSDYTGTACGNEDTPPYQNAWITTANPIDFTGHANVALTYTQAYKKWYDTTFVEFSFDGVNFNSSIIVNATATGTLEPNPDFVSLNVSSVVGNQSQVWLRFRFAGDWDYAWMIDDIKFIEGAENEIAFEGPSAIFGAGYYHQMPINQRIPITDFIGPVFNNGFNAQTNVAMNVKIFMDDGTTPVYDNNSNTPVSIASVAAGQRDTLKITGDPLLYFYADTTAYHWCDVDFSVTQTEVDQNPSNNFASSRFFITDSVLNRATTVSRYFGVTNFTGGTSGDILGQRMYISNPDSVSSITVKFHSGLTVNGINAVRPQLYYWNTTTSAWALQIEGNDIILTTDMKGSFVTLPFLKDMTSEYVTGGDYYIAGIRCIVSDDSLDNIAMGADATYPHDYQMSSAGCFGGTWYYISSGVPLVQLNFIRNTPVPNDVAYVISKEVNVYPNPTNGNLNIENAPNSNIIVFNMLGEAVASLNNSSTFSTIDLSGLAEGTYIVKILSAENVITKKINLVK